MKKTIGQSEIYQSPSLTEINIKIQRCITATSGELSDWSEENVSGSWEIE